MCVTNGRHLGVNRLPIGGICELRWGVDDVGLSDLGMASFIRSASPSAVVLTITLSLGRSMTRRSRIAARGPARSSYRPAEGCRSVRLRVRPAERAGPARRHWRRLSRFEPAGLPWTTPFRTPPGALRNPRRTPVPVRRCLFRAACNMGLEGLVSKRQDRPYQGGRSKDWVKVKNRKDPAMERVKDAFS